MLSPESEDASDTAQTTQVEQTTAEPDRPPQMVDSREYNALSANQIQRVIRRNVKQMRKCVVKQLKRDPSITGRLNVVATIKPSGYVSRVRIDTRRFRGTVVEKCLKRKIKYWKFPAFDGPPFEARFPLQVAARY